MGEGKTRFDLLLDDTGVFSIVLADKKIFHVSKAGDINVNGNVRAKGSLRVDGKFYYAGMNQWFVAARDYFSKGAAGWSNTSTSECGKSKTLLGGYGKFGGGNTTKSIRKLTDHTELRVTTNFHFIDSWQGEMAYLVIDGVIVWTDSYSLSDVKEGINICGGPAREAKFASNIDVVIPHSSTSVTITFGTTLAGTPFTQSWGLDDVTVYLR